MTLPMLYDPRDGAAALERAMERLQAQASAAVRAGHHRDPVRSWRDGEARPSRACSPPPPCI